MLPERGKCMHIRGMLIGIYLLTYQNTFAHWKLMCSVTIFVCYTRLHSICRMKPFSCISECPVVIQLCMVLVHMNTSIKHLESVTIAGFSRPPFDAYSKPNFRAGENFLQCGCSLAYQMSDRNLRDLLCINITLSAQRSWLGSLMSSNKLQFLCSRTVFCSSLLNFFFSTFFFFWILSVLSLVSVSSVIPNLPDCYCW